MAEFDIQKLISELVEKVKSDESLKEGFLKDPLQMVKKHLPFDIPEDAIEKIVEGVKAKVSLDKIGEAADALKGLLGKK